MTSTRAARAEEAASPTSGVVISAPFASSAALLRAGDARAIESDWADLAAHAVEPNPFYSPALLIPALDAFADEAVRIASVRDERGRLIALAPVAPCFGYSHLPVRYVSTWMHEHCFFAAPLVRRGSEERALSGLFDLIEDEGVFLRLRHLEAGGALARLAAKAASATGRLSAPSAGRRRALLAGGFRAEGYLGQALSSKKRKELRRLRARLKEQGALAFETFGGGDDIDHWTDEFLMLESAGWKGGAKTALANSQAGRSFFTAALRRAREAQLLDFHRLRVGERVIAMIVNFIDRGAGYSFKIAYDEDYARYSPGVLLEIEMMRVLEARPGLSFMDSCAAEDHPMINSLWRGRRMIEALNISRKSRSGKMAFRALVGLERLGESLRRREFSKPPGENVDVGL